MNRLNRSAQVAPAREPYLHWAASLDRDAPEVAKDLAVNTSAYLVNEDPTGFGGAPPIDDSFAEIFVLELAA